MGILTRTAEKTFKQASRRAHVPDWFQPASYALVGLLVVVAAVTAVLSGGSPSETPTSTVDPGFMAPITSPLTAPATAPLTSPLTSPLTAPPVVSTPAPPAAPASSDPAAETAFVDESGVEVRLPTAALDAARRAVAALFTGDYTGVALAAGLQPTAPVAVFADPDVSGPVTAIRFPDGSWRIGFNVDPDRTGPELARRIGVTVLPGTAGWEFGG